jgi:hypothetical protein
VAVGETNGDSYDDIITGAGPGGGPHVRVFDGATLANTVNFLAYDPDFHGGVNVAALPGIPDILGRVGIVTAPASNGGPDVRVFNPIGNHEFDRFLAYDPKFTGGVTISVAQIGPNGTFAILTGAGPGGGPHLKAFRPTPMGPPTLLQSFFAFDPGFIGGVFVG